MRRRKKAEAPAIVERAVESAQEPKLPEWERFFWCQHSPVLRSQLLTALMCGTVLSVDRLPTKALLDALLLAFAARVYCSAEIVDEWERLLERTREEWDARDPNRRTSVFDQAHFGVSLRIATQPWGPVTEFACYEDQYIPELVGWYLQQDAPVYFAQEFESDAAIKQWRRRK